MRNFLRMRNSPGIDHPGSTNARNTALEGYWNPAIASATYAFLANSPSASLAESDESLTSSCLKERPKLFYPAIKTCFVP